MVRRIVLTEQIMRLRYELERAKEWPIWDSDNYNGFVASYPRQKDRGFLISLNAVRGSRYGRQRLSVRPVSTKQYKPKVIKLT